MSKKALVVVPHPDDEVLGFGGTISKLVQSSWNVDVIFTTVPDEPNARYFAQRQAIPLAAKVLGYKFVELQFKAREIYPLNSIIDFFESIIASYNPNILYIPHPNDTHQDHKNLFEVLRIATRVNGSAFIKKVLCGEIISSTDTSISLTNRFNPNSYETLSKQDVDSKIEALSKYEHEMREFPHPRSQQGMSIHANKRGMECNAQFAEAFQVLRWVN
jgi:LmbE family N-acetylglucosaminyl deacetylase